MDDIVTAYCGFGAPVVECFGMRHTTMEHVQGQYEQSDNLADECDILCSLGVCWVYGFLCSELDAPQQCLYRKTFYSTHR